MEYLIFETRLCVEITKFQSELTKLQRTERCETQNIQRQFSFPSTNLFVTVAERQQNTTTTTKKKKMRRNRNKTALSLFFWGLSSSSLSIWPRQVMTKHNAFSVCVAITQDTHTRTHTRSFHSHSPFLNHAKTGLSEREREGEIHRRTTRYARPTSAPAAAASASTSASTSTSTSS